MAAPAPEPGGAPPAGAGGSGGAQILQQIEGLLAQLAEAEPEPQIQQAIQGIQQQLEPLQQIVGKDDMQDMQSGLANPSGGGAMPPAGGGGEEEPPSAGGEASGSGGGQGPTHEVEIHIRPADKSFAGARKAAMATHSERGHFDRNTPKGQTPQTDRTKNKAKG